MGDEREGDMLTKTQQELAILLGGREAYEHFNGSAESRTPPPLVYAGDARFILKMGKRPSKEVDKYLVDHGVKKQRINGMGQRNLNCYLRSDVVELAQKLGIR